MGTVAQLQKEIERLKKKHNSITDAEARELREENDNLREELNQVTAKAAAAEERTKELEQEVGELSAGVEDCARDRAELLASKAALEDMLKKDGKLPAIEDSRESKSTDVAYVGKPTGKNVKFKKGK